MNQFKIPEAAHKKFNHKVKSSLLEMYREGIKQKIDGKTREQIKEFIQNKLGNIMIDSFNSFLNDLEINESGFKFEFKNGAFKIVMPENFRHDASKILRNKKGYNEAKINEFFDFLDQYPAKLTTQFSEEANILAKFIYEKKPIESVQKEIDSISSQFDNELGKMVYSLFCLTCIAAFVTGVAILFSTGALPITVMSGVCSSSMFFFLARPEALTSALSSPAKMVVLSRKINDYKITIKEINEITPETDLSPENIQLIQEKYENEKSNDRGLSKLDTDVCKYGAILAELITERKASAEKSK